MSDLDKSTRRDFLLRGVKAAAAVVATGFIAQKFKDTAGPEFETSSGNLTELPNFSIAGMSGKMAIVAGADRVKTVRRALDSIGGIGHFIGRGDRVVLKVNAGFAAPSMLSATTHPDLVAEVVRLCIAAGAATVVVTDNSINDPVSCFELSGIAPAARAAGASVILPAADLFRSITLSGGTLIRDWPFLAAPLADATRLIGIAPVKDHHRAGASMIMKNWYGLLGGRRNLFHQNINDIVKELALLVKPTLVILDGTTTMMTNGPTGGS